MPSTNVTIEAEFIKTQTEETNPETSDTAIIICLLIIISGIGLTYFNVRKMSELV